MTANQKRTPSQFLARMAEAHRQAASLRTETESEDESVRVVITGDRTLDSLHLDEQALPHHTADSLADAIIDAYNAGQRRAFEDQVTVFADIFNSTEWKM